MFLLLQLGTLISQTHLLLFLLRTPRYTGCLVSLNTLLPAFFFGLEDAKITSEELIRFEEELVSEEEVSEYSLNDDMKKFIRKN
jgi:hypothetical protein